MPSARASNRTGRHAAFVGLFLLLCAGAGSRAAPPEPSLDGMDPAVAGAIRDARAGLANLAAGPGYGALGLAYQRAGLYAPAAAAFARARAAQPEQRTWAYGEAFALEAMGEFANAISAWRSLLQRWPEDHEVRTRLARLYLDANQIAPALEVIVPATRARQPATRAAAQMQAGRAHLALGEFRRAREYLEPAVAAWPQLARLRWMLAMALRGEGRREDANHHLAVFQELEEKSRREFTQRMAQRPSDAQQHMARGLAAHARGDLQQAEREWRLALVTDPGLGPARLALARLLREARRFREARALLSGADLDAAMLLERGRLEWRAGERRAAQEFLQRAFAANDGPEQRLALADALMQKEPQQAAVHYQVLVDSHPDKFRLWRRLAAAGEVLRAGIARHPRDPELWNLLLRLHALQGQVLPPGFDAVTVIAALRRASDDPRYLRTQAMLRAATGDFPRAAQLLESAHDPVLAADLASYRARSMPADPFADEPSMLAPTP
ncbi:MAG: tetratricopeptide repeat protein [Gammaproteobacteria bacterium]|nr:tetratricopeptide repeat protein [Gammaproteobacteria bacterium]